MIVTRTSPLSGIVHQMEIDVTDAQLAELASSGKPVQQVLGHLPPDQREFLVSGITAAEWDAYLGGDDE